MRIGIYGGTFNPIHTAHVHLVREFIKRLSLDRVILIPTGTPPHKATHQLASGADRIEMCRLAAADIAECPVTVSDIEVLRTGKSYTADTMTELKAQYPDAVVLAHPECKSTVLKLADVVGSTAALLKLSLIHI